MTPEEIINQANQLREKNEQAAKKAKEKQAAQLAREQNRPAPANSEQSDKYMTYRRLFGNPFIWYPACFILIGMPLYYFGMPTRVNTEEGNDTYDLYILLLIVGLIALTELLILCGYFLFRNWRNRLPFTVEGWGALVDAEDFGDYQQWRRCTVTLELTAGYSPELIKSLLYIFCQKANKQYYYTEDGTIEKWTSGTTLNFSGSINKDVAKVLYKFISRDLKNLHRNGNIQVQKVIISPSSKSRYFSRPSSD